MKLKDIKTIDVFTRWFYDVLNGNPYYSRKIVVNINSDSEEIFCVPVTWGSVNDIENDHIEIKLGLRCAFNRCIMQRYIGNKLCKVHSIKYNFHKAKRIYNFDSLKHPERFKNI